MSKQVLFSQAYTYFLRYQSDRPAIKSFVVYILVLETISAVITILIIYQPLVVDFGRESVLTELPVGLVAEPAVVVLIATPTHFFVAKRIQGLQRSIWIPLLICIVSVISFTGGIWASVATGRFGRYSDRYPVDMYAPAMLWMVSAAIADSLIAATLSWSLYTRRTGFRSTDAVIGRIILCQIRYIAPTEWLANLDKFTM
ncbi:unnamed protein product [Cyclocybe aegerita]|uniref:Uncharacterized protein n=1 Tax=Cyclocybe aegerita TaxID=1973307 RepID=A0A8S0WW64_CYCAE|nr:unnamed protein product [Cyclocybe aegerita]